MLKSPTLFTRKRKTEKRMKIVQAHYFILVDLEPITGTLGLKQDALEVKHQSIT